MGSELEHVPIRRHTEANGKSRDVKRAKQGVKRGTDGSTSAGSTPAPSPGSTATGNVINRPAISDLSELSDGG